MGRNNLVGAWGEGLAAEFLRKKHYTLDAMNYRSRFGEIDIIVHNRKYLVFVEVKLRKTDSFAKGSFNISECCIFILESLACQDLGREVDGTGRSAYSIPANSL